MEHLSCFNCYNCNEFEQKTECVMYTVLYIINLMGQNPHLLYVSFGYCDIDVYFFSNI